MLYDISGGNKYPSFWDVLPAFLISTAKLKESIYLFFLSKDNSIGIVARNSTKLVK